MQKLDTSIWVVARCVKILGRCYLMPGTAKAARGRERAREYCDRMNREKKGGYVMRRVEWL